MTSENNCGNYKLGIAYPSGMPYQWGMSTTGAATMTALADRTFGIELEMHLPEGKTRGMLATAIRKHARVNIKCTRYDHMTRDYWRVTTDASLGYDRRRSAEVVSPILTGERGIAATRKVAEAALEFGCTVSAKCGFHVHVGVKDCTLDELRKLAINFVSCETAFDAIVPPSRRRDSNNFIQSNRTDFGGGYFNGGVNKAIDAFTACADIASLIRSVSAASAPEGRDYWRATRYRKLNLSCYDRQKTVEFRQHAGTVEADKIEHWIRLCVAMVERSRKSQPRKRPSEKEHNQATELGMLLKFLRLSDESVEFFRKRRIEFLDLKAKPVVARQSQPMHVPGAAIPIPPPMTLVATDAILPRDVAGPVRRRMAPARRPLVSSERFPE
jgi:hypothetical protein